MERNFARALSLVLKSEGGWSDNPADPGGATMKGVTLATFRRYIDPKGTKDDLRHITDAQLAQVYRQQYWAAVGGDDLPDGVDYAVFDFAVNSGPGRAARYLQSVVGAPMDGVIGPATLAAVAKMPAGVIIDRLCDARLAFLEHLPTWPTFGRGWSIRVAQVRKEALLMTSSSIAAPAPTNPAPAPQPASPAPVQPAPAPGAPPKATAAPVPPKPVAKHVGIGAAGLAVGGLIATYWHELVAWIHHWF